MRAILAFRNNLLRFFNNAGTNKHVYPHKHTPSGRMTQQLITDNNKLNWGETLMNYGMYIMLLCHVFNGILKACLHTH